MKKTKVVMNKPVYLGLFVLDINKIVMLGLRKTRIRRRRKIMLHGYVQFYSTRKNGSLRRPYRRC